VLNACDNLGKSELSKAAQEERGSEFKWELKSKQHQQFIAKQITFLVFSQI